jgi:putative endonuclease
MACYVYFLFSETTKKFYVGVSNDVADRLSRHNNAESLSTKSGVPWTLIQIIECLNKPAAMQLEIKIKKRGIRRFLMDINFPGDSVPV